MIHLRKTTLTMKKTGNCVGTHVQKRARTKENPRLRKDVRARVRVIVCVCVCVFAVFLYPLEMDASLYTVPP